MLDEKLYEKGLEGLYSNYRNCGHKSKLTYEQLTELRKIITFGNESYSIDDVQKIIKDNWHECDYKTVWTIVRKKLGLNYGNHPSNTLIIHKIQKTT